MADPDRTISQLPHALSANEWATRLGGSPPSLFLDYDGVLTPIVDDPTAATLDDAMRDAVARARDAMPVAVISGRDLDDVRSLVDVPGLAYAGSHGFDMLLPDGDRERMGEDHLDDLDDAERRLHDALDGLDGVQVERKRYAIAVHTRRVTDDDVRAQVGDVAEEVAAGTDRLRLSPGRAIHELKPAIDWDKGRALLRLAEVLELDLDGRPPVYVGDDVTDEDAFAVIVDGGVGVVVAGADERSTAAALRLDGPDQTRDLLDLLTDLATRA